ncbi:hypothetical protein HPP92_013915 [Vanilla planifolia]|uniref:F-box domain-containing protein n=1 Tax=Vanilla planifolia TaxID=51239 RepID=A0A835QVR5_VANPL|nr:hypothetical protein HPP92_013915 [Vanilla planifolia]
MLTTCLFKYPNQLPPFPTSRNRRHNSSRAEHGSVIMEVENRSWEEMPLDCLVNIFSKVGLDNLATAVPFVCKSWSRASADPICWRILDLRRLDFKSSSPFASSFVSLFPLCRFSFSGFLKLALARSRGTAVDLRVPSVSKEDLFLASNSCPKLKNLALPLLASEEEEQQVLQLVEKCKDLEVLEMDSKPSVSARVGEADWDPLQQLPRAEAPRLDHEGGRRGGREFPSKLSFLDLSNCRLGREELLAIVAGCRDLRRLCVKDCVGFDADDEVRRRGTDIEVFEFEGSKVEEECDNGEYVDEPVDLEQMFRYFDDCYLMWLY